MVCKAYKQKILKKKNYLKKKTNTICMVETLKNNSITITKKKNCKKSKNYFHFMEAQKNELINVWVN